jgi:hypothetical protein
MKIRSSSIGVLSVNLLAPVAAICVLLCTQATQAQVINFDVPGSTESDWNENNPTLNYDFGTNFVGQGALSDPGNNFWNAVQGNGTTSGGLLSDGVTSSSITLTTSGFTEYGGNSFGNNVTNDTPPALFTPFVYGGSLILSNVAAGVYNLFVYAQNGSDIAYSGPTSITVGGQTLTTTVDNSEDYETFTLGVNYEEFTGVSPVLGTISISLGDQANFNGLQLQMIATPTTPTSLAATAGSGSVGLSWSGSTGSPGPITYNIGRSTTNGGSYTIIGSSPTNSFTDSSLTDPSSPPVNGTTYYYVVYAVNNGAISPASNQAGATPIGPSAPVLTAVTPGNSQVALSWMASTGADDNITYNVLRATTNGGPYLTIETGQSGINFTDSSSTDPSSPPVNGTTYYYVVQALDDGASPASSIEAIATPPGAPTPVTGLNATAGLLQVGLSWTASATISPGPITYNIGRSITNGGPYVIIATGQSGTTYTDTSVGENAYYYVVYALNDGVGPSIASAQASATPTGPPLVVNFDVPGMAGVVGIAGAVNYSGLGAYPDAAANTNWNPVVNGGTTGPAIASDRLSITPITLTAPSLNTFNRNNYGGTPTGPEVLFTPFAYSTSAYTLTLSNVPAGNYDLYIYGINGSDASEGNSTAFTVGGITQDTLQTISPNSSTNFVQDGSYVQFAGVSPSNGVITIDVVGAGVGGNPSEADFNGLQLTPYLIEPPVVTGEPKSEELFAGATATFFTAANGGGLSYQWYAIGNNGTTVLSGATNATLIINNVSAANATNYYCSVTNNNTGAYQATNSAVATLIIVSPSGSFEAGVTNLNPVHYYAFDDTGDPSSGSEVALDYAGSDNGVYGMNCDNGFDSTAGPRLSPDGFPGFASTNYAVLTQEGFEPNNVPVNLPWLLNTNTVTITAWINPGYQPQSTGTIIVMNSGGTSAVGDVTDIESLQFINSTNTGNSDLGYTWNNDAATTSWDSGLMPPANQWSFVALVVTPTNATISMMNADGITNAIFVHNHANAAFAGRTIIGDNPAFLTGPQTGFYTFDGEIDELGVFNRALTQTQLGNLFADATQSPVFVVPATITSIAQTGESLTLAGNNGAAYGTYHVLTSTNLALPLKNWTVLTNGTFNSFGNFNAALSISNNSSPQFFSIKSP